MARRRRSYFRSRRFSRPKRVRIPLAIVAGVLPTAGDAISSFKAGMATNIGEAFRLSGAKVMADLSGYDPISQTWQWSNFQRGAVPMILGIIAHKAAGYLGVNRALGRLGVPLVRI